MNIWTSLSIQSIPKLVKLFATFQRRCASLSKFMFAMSKSAIVVKFAIAVDPVFTKFRFKLNFIVGWLWDLV